MSRAYEIIEDVTPLSRVFCSADYDRAIAYLQDILPFDVLEYPAGGDHNGWVIPPSWEVAEAKILTPAGDLIYDGTTHPLRVISLSAPFTGEVSLEELKAHIHFDHRYHDVVPFHFRQQYRPWDRDWGFCAPRAFVEGLANEQYAVQIDTREAPGVLKVLDYTHRGRLPETFAFVAHLDHPGMSNDDLAGCAVGVEFFCRLAERQTKFSYKLLLVQEIVGSEYWWGLTNPGNREGVLEAVFLEMLGTRTRLALQESVNADSNLEHALGAAMDDAGIDYRTGPFKSIIVNDEYVWESHGIPMASLSRYPYPEYHTDRDNPSIISPEALEEAVGILERAVDRLETGTLVRKRFNGTVCLSNPRFDLYVDPGQPAFGTSAPEDQRRLRLLMDLVPTLTQPTTVESLAARVELQPEVVRSYLDAWREKDLVELI